MWVKRSERSTSSIMSHNLWLKHYDWSFLWTPKFGTSKLEPSNWRSGKIKARQRTDWNVGNGLWNLTSVEIWTEDDVDPARLAINRQSLVVSNFEQFEWLEAIDFIGVNCLRSSLWAVEYDFCFPPLASKVFAFSSGRKCEHFDCTLWLYIESVYTA